MRRIQGLSCWILGLVCLLSSMPLATAGQGMQNIVQSRERLFPSIGPGVAALRRDAARHYYILAEPASRILIFDSTGRSIGQIPNANSRGATIKYAVSIDLDSRGRLYVADRGANAVKIFLSDGALLATVPVTAPTSVVALSDGEFAVTKLQSKRLVQIMDRTGAAIRSFGDPQDESPVASPSEAIAFSSASPAPLPIMDRGRIAGDSSGNIYFAFTSLADPAIQRFDRYGYSAYDSVMPSSDFGALSGRTGRDIEIGYTMAGVTGRDSVTAWTDLHSVKASVGRTGRGRRGRGAAGGSMPDSSTANGASGAAAAGSSSDDSSTPDIAGDFTDLDGDTLSYDAQNLSNSGPLFSEGGWGGDSSYLMPGMMGMGFGDPFRFHGFRGGEGAGDLSGAHPDFGGAGAHPPDGAMGFGHFHSGFSTYRATATLRVALDDPSKHKFEKPVITAVGIDPQTQETWAAVGDMLVHLDRNGNRVDLYYLTINGTATIKPSAILVEPDRLLIAADPWGVYEFPRPDKAALGGTGDREAVQPADPQPTAAAPHRTLLPEQVSPAAAQSTSTQPAH